MKMRLTWTLLSESEPSVTFSWILVMDNIFVLNTIPWKSGALVLSLVLSVTRMAGQSHAHDQQNGRKMESGLAGLMGCAPQTAEKPFPIPNGREATYFRVYSDDIDYRRQRYRTTYMEIK